jgi:hypothetical protein
VSVFDCITSDPARMMASPAYAGRGCRDHSHGSVAKVAASRRALTIHRTRRDQTRAREGWSAGRDGSIGRTWWARASPFRGLESIRSYVL